LGQTAPTLLCDYPASQAALARIRPGASPLAGRASDGNTRTQSSPLAGRASDGDAAYPVAERFELYVRGIELANGYHELLDADELSARMARANIDRQSDGKPPLPTDNRLLAAMRAGLPPCCGVALGFDRLVLLAAGAQRLSDVIPFPIDRA
jgi:lysyl-tRNA synthetase class 2